MPATSSTVRGISPTIFFEKPSYSSFSEVFLGVPPLALLHCSMARRRKSRGLGLHQETHLSPCPRCGKCFADILRHLNHRDSKCGDWFFLLPDSGLPFSPHPGFDAMDDRPPSPLASDPELTPDSIHGHPRFQTIFPGASAVYGRGKSFMDRFNDDKHASYRVQNPYYPFADQEEWELGSFLLRSGMSMQKTDEFLRLRLVIKSLVPPTLCTDPTCVQIKQAGVTFHTAKDLRNRVEMLPGAPEWKSKPVSLTGNATKEPTFLFYRDALDCVEYLFGNPIFSNGIDFCPVRLYRNSERTIRTYTEWMTGNAAWEMQVCPHPYSDCIYIVLYSS